MKNKVYKKNLGAKKNLKNLILHPPENLKKFLRKNFEDCILEITFLQILETAFLETAFSDIALFETAFLTNVVSETAL